MFKSVKERQEIIIIRCGLQLLLLFCLWLLFCLVSSFGCCWRLKHRTIVNHQLCCFVITIQGRLIFPAMVREGRLRCKFVDTCWLTRIKHRTRRLLIQIIAEGANIKTAPFIYFYGRHSQFEWIINKRSLLIKFHNFLVCIKSLALTL